MEERTENNANSRNVLLVVSFGTAVAESRRLDIEPVEQAVREAAGDSWSTRRCFSSRRVIDIILKNEGVVTESIEEAVGNALHDGARNIAVQPTHLMKGHEYGKLKRILAGYEECFEKISAGEPLLSSEEDFDRVSEALVEASAEYEDGETALVFMGHGTDASSNGVYMKLQEKLRRKGRSGYYIGTVEAGPSPDDVIAAVRKGPYRRAVIRPLLLAAGNHAINDMASPDDPGSWYSRFTAAGYDTVCIREGLGRLPAIRDIYACHAKRAIGSLNL